MWRIVEERRDIRVGSLAEIAEFLSDSRGARPVEATLQIPYDRRPAPMVRDACPLNRSSKPGVFSERPSPIWD
jgi:hypothetical protein